MPDKAFHWPNNARIAFALGLAFESLDRSQTTAGQEFVNFA